MRKANYTDLKEIQSLKVGDPVYVIKGNKNATSGFVSGFSTETIVLNDRLAPKQVIWVDIDHHREAFNRDTGVVFSSSEYHIKDYLLPVNDETAALVTLKNIENEKFKKEEEFNTAIKAINQWLQSELSAVNKSKYEPHYPLEIIDLLKPVIESDEWQLVKRKMEQDRINRPWREVRGETK